MGIIQIENGVFHSFTEYGIFQVPHGQLTCNIRIKPGTSYKPL